MGQRIDRRGNGWKVRLGVGLVRDCLPSKQKTPELEARASRLLWGLLSGGRRYSIAYPAASQAAIPPRRAETLVYPCS
jgi:hypothetical protein